MKIRITTTLKLSRAITISSEEDDKLSILKDLCNETAKIAAECKDDSIIIPFEERYFNFEGNIEMCLFLNRIGTELLRKACPNATIVEDDSYYRDCLMRSQCRITFHPEIGHIYTVCDPSMPETKDFSAWLEFSTNFLDMEIEKEDGI